MLALASIRNKMGHQKQNLVNRIRKESDDGNTFRGAVGATDSGFHGTHAAQTSVPAIPLQDCPERRAYPFQNSPTVSAMPTTTMNTRSAFSLITLSIFAPA